MLVATCGEWRQGWTPVPKTDRYFYFQISPRPANNCRSRLMWSFWFVVNEHSVVNELWRENFWSQSKIRLQKIIIHLLFQSNLSLKISHQKLKNSTRGGGQKSAKKVSRIIWMAPNEQGQIGKFSTQINPVITKPGFK